MNVKSWLWGTAALGVALVGGTSLFASPARASYIVTLTEVGSNVVAIGGGTIDTAGLRTPNGSQTANPLVQANTGTIYTGTAGSEVDTYLVAGPSRFGNGFENLASSSKGDFVGITGGISELLLPANYTSGAALSDSATYDNRTFSSLGVTPGSYKWNWGTGADADSFTLNVGTASAVPEPSSLLLLALPVGFLVLFATRRRTAVST